MRIKKKKEKRMPVSFTICLWTDLAYMYFVKDYRLFDKVRYQGRKNYLIERRTVWRRWRIPPRLKNLGYPSPKFSMKVKDLLENYQGDNYIEIYDCFSWQTKGFNNKEVAIRKYGHYTVQSWTVLTTKNKIKITIRSQM